MPLPTFKTKDEVPEAVRDGYIERDGVWVPDVEDVDGLKKNRDDALREAKESKRIVADLKRQLEDKASGKSDDEIAKQRAREEELTKPLQEQLAAVTAQLRKEQLDGKVLKMFADSGVNPKRLDALFKLVGERFDLSDEGTPILKDKPTTDLVKYIGETVSGEFPEFFVSKQKGGAEFPGGAGGPIREDLSKLLTSNPQALLHQANQKAA